MNKPQPLRTTISGYRSAPSAEKAGFEMLSAFAATIAVSRATNYVRERRRRAPLVRSILRRAYHAPGENQLRVHQLDNPYRDSQLLALAQGSLAALGAAVLALRFHRRGSTMAAPSTMGPPSGSDDRRSPTAEAAPDQANSHTDETPLRIQPV